MESNFLALMNDSRLFDKAMKNVCDSVSGIARNHFTFGVNVTVGVHTSGFMRYAHNEFGAFDAVKQLEEAEKQVSQDTAMALRQKSLAQSRANVALLNEETTALEANTKTLESVKNHYTESVARLMPLLALPPQPKPAELVAALEAALKQAKIEDARTKTDVEFDDFLNQIAADES